MNNYNYDRELFESNCGQIQKCKYDEMNKTQLIAAMTIDYHRIEKGLSMHNTKQNFGLKSGVLKRLYDMNKVYISKFGNDDKILKIIYHSIQNYYDWHKEKKVTIQCSYMEKYLQEYVCFREKYDVKRIGGIRKIQREDILSDLKTYDSFFMSRRSVRKYCNKDVDVNIVKKCINNALYGTPTVCNRPVNEVHLIKDYNMRKKLLSYQNGNSGFGIYAPIILIITTCLENFQNSTERRAPYIGGGMFAQSLVYTLHAEGLATCCLNWDVDYKKDIEVRKMLTLKNETIIMYMSIGHYPDEYEVAISDKPDLKDIITYHV
jgi:nitroreductase